MFTTWSSVIQNFGENLSQVELQQNGLGQSDDAPRRRARPLSYGPPWAHYLGGYRDRLLGGPLGLPGLRYTAPDGVEHKDYGGEVLC
jgi:hypothetical protein